MKPFSKNLFSQTPVAFGWLPEEAINLDISMCVRTCVCGHVCVCVCVCTAWIWVRDFFFCYCFVLSHADASVSKSRSIRKRANVQRRDSPDLSRLKHNTPPLSRVPPSHHHSAPSSQLRSPNASPKHPSTSTPPTTPPSPPPNSDQSKFRRHLTHTHMEVQVKRRATILTSQHTATTTHFTPDRKKTHTFISKGNQACHWRGSPMTPNLANQATLVVFQTDSSVLLQQFVFGGLCLIVREEESTPQSLQQLLLLPNTGRLRCWQNGPRGPLDASEAEMCSLFSSVCKRGGFAIRVFHVIPRSIGCVQLHSWANGIVLNKKMGLLWLDDKKDFLIMCRPPWMRNLLSRAFWGVSPVLKYIINWCIYVF